MFLGILMFFRCVCTVAWASIMVFLVAGRKDVESGWYDGRSFSVNGRLRWQWIPLVPTSSVMRST